MCFKKYFRTCGQGLTVMEQCSIEDWTEECSSPGTPLYFTKKKKKKKWDWICSHYSAPNKVCRELCSRLKAITSLPQPLSSTYKHFIWVIAESVTASASLDRKLKKIKRMFTFYGVICLQKLPGSPVQTAKYSPCSTKEHTRCSAHTLWGDLYCFVPFAKSSQQHCDSYVGSILAPNDPGPFKPPLSQL